MIDVTFGAEVTDDAGYAAYRSHLAPLLAAAGGAFVLDVRVAAVLKAPGAGSFNRLFTLRLPSAEAFTALFDSPAYRAIRAAYFEASVASIRELARATPITRA